MPRSVASISYLLGLTTLLLVGCNSGGSDNTGAVSGGLPRHGDFQQARIGTSTIQFGSTNLVYLPGTGRVTVDVNRPVDVAKVRESLAFHMTITGDGRPANPFSAQNLTVDQFDLAAKGRLVADDPDLGIISFVSNTGTLDYSVSPGVPRLAPGFRYRFNIDSLYSETNELKKDAVTLRDQNFTLVPFSIPLLPYDTRLETDGLVNRLLLGGVTVDRADSSPTLAPLSVAKTVEIDLATNINPGTFEGSLAYELQINNLTTQHSYQFGKADLANNGIFSYPNLKNNVILWTKTSADPLDGHIGLDGFVDASGQYIRTSSVGDVVEYQIARVSGKINNGSTLTLRDRAFRVLHTFS